MEVTFKFEIGQFLYIKQELRRWHQVYGGIEPASANRGYQSMGDLASMEHKPSALQVIERHLQECYGGVQLLYHFRGGLRDALIVLTEPEVTVDFNDPSVIVAK